jgi:hypothetical protein
MLKKVANISRILFVGILSYSGSLATQLNITVSGLPWCVARKAYLCAAAGASATPAAVWQIQASFLSSIEDVSVLVAFNLLNTIWGFQGHLEGRNSQL